MQLFFGIVSIVLVIIWLFMVISVWQNDNVSDESSRLLSTMKFGSNLRSIALPNSKRYETQTHLASDEHSFSSPTKGNMIPLPPKYIDKKPDITPVSIEEVEKNMTLYLKTLHERLGALAGPHATALEVWSEYVDITKSMPMQWDQQNKDRQPPYRYDKSIFVALGTYRDPFCPMTIKSLYKQAEFPERLFVGLFQQNCFGPKCRTGVLKGGKVDDAGPDMDCYVEFCKSPEGIASNACNNGNVRLYNVNESESLGPYMARYLGSKFYRGEQYYLQIDSHSEFAMHWDSKLIKMVQDAPAEKPVISTYPPGAEKAWQDTTGLRLCDSEFASAQIEWQIIRLGSPVAFEKRPPSVPKVSILLCNF